MGAVSAVTGGEGMGAGGESADGQRRGAVAHRHLAQRSGGRGAAVEERHRPSGSGRDRCRQDEGSSISDTAGCRGVELDRAGLQDTQFGGIGDHRRGRLSGGLPQAGPIEETVVRGCHRGGGIVDRSGSRDVAPIRTGIEALLPLHPPGSETVASRH